MDIRRKVLFIMFVLCLGIIVSGCDNGGNNAESEGGGNSMSDVNDVVMNEENKQVEPKSKDVFSENVTNTLDHASYFNASVIDGKYLQIAIRSYNNSSMNVILYVNNRRYKVYKIDKDNQGLIIPYTPTASSSFKIVYEVTNGENMAIFINVRQYETKP